MDYPKDIVIINIKDKDGIIVGGTTYKIANGAKILMSCTNYPKINWDNYINTQENLSTKVDVANTLSKSLGPVKFSGNVRPTITLDILITVQNDVPTRENYAAMSGTVAMSHYILYNLWRYPHRLYLTDMVDNTTYTNLDLPINILINRKDLLDQTIFSEDGIPVVLKSITQKNDFTTQDKETLKEQAHFEYTLTFIMDNYGA